MTGITSVGAERIVTLGHSRLEPGRFLALLSRNAVEVLVDVRSSPYSKIAPQFSQAPLRTALEQAGIRYVFEGEALGGRPADPDFYDSDGRVLYHRMAKSGLFLSGIQRLRRGSEANHVAIMCSEEDPAGCHRHLLVARVLSELGVEVAHLRADGTTQPYGVMSDVKRRAAVPTLFSGEDEGWKSIRSVSPRGPQKASSGH